jgi:hypothetical protein
MIKMSVTAAPKFDGFAEILTNRSKEFYDKAMQWVVEDIVRGIIARKGVDGARFPDLEESTIVIKGHDKPLIDRGLLSDVFTYAQVNEHKRGFGQITIRPLTAAKKPRGSTKRAKAGTARDKPRDEVGYALQVEGLKNGKHFNFFGISLDAEEKIMALIEIMVEDALKDIAKAQ